MNEFFYDMRESSEVKSVIVEKYFATWSKIITSSNSVDKIAYIDLYCGPGVYEDGKESTPMKILKQCIANNKLHDKIVCIFNDKDEKNVKKLDKNIQTLKGIEKLKYKPKCINSEVNQEIELIFNKERIIPSFSFIDPFGYKGLTHELIKGITKDWGCDCIFFFNYNRINAAINNPKVKDKIDALFGEACANELREKIKEVNPKKRELIILDEFCKSLSKDNERYTLPFRFKDLHKNRTSHYLIFITKHPKGYEVMKDIMCNESSNKIDGVGSFSFIPYDDNCQLEFIDRFSKSLEELENMLLKDFKGVKDITVSEIFTYHNLNTPYTKKNYKDALKNLEKKDLIEVVSKKSRKKYANTMADANKIIFLESGDENFAKNI